MVEGLLAALLDLVDAASEEGRGQLAVYRVSERLRSEPNEHKLCFTVEKGGYVPYVAASTYPSLPWLEPSSPGYSRTSDPDIEQLLLLPSTCFFTFVFVFALSCDLSISFSLASPPSAAPVSDIDTTCVTPENGRQRRHRVRKKKSCRRDLCPP